MTNKKNVTIQMVADRAGVSKSTVSRVISDYPDISDKTKKKVYQVMRDLNYYPSAIARSLANKKSKNVGLVLPADDDFFENPFFRDSLRAIAKTASSRGYDTLIAYNGDNETLSVKRLVKANKVDGVIMMRSIISDPTIEYLRERKFPFVLIGKSLDYKDVYSVDTNNFEAAKKITEKLVKKGCKKIAFIGGNKESVVTIDRFNGYLECIKDNNLIFDDTLIQKNEFRKCDGYLSIKRILEKNPDLDGLVVTDAIIFSGVLEYIEKMGKGNKNLNLFNIVIGTFGTDNTYNSKLDIVNVDVDYMELGRASCDKIINMLEGKEVNEIDIIDYILK